MKQKLLQCVMTETDRQETTEQHLDEMQRLEGIIEEAETEINAGAEAKKRKDSAQKEMYARVRSFRYDMRYGKINKMVSVEEIKDFDAKVVKEIRLDSGEVINSREMTERELQPDLPLEPDPAAEINDEKISSIAKNDEIHSSSAESKPDRDDPHSSIAEQCDECHRIDGAHTASCSQNTAVTQESAERYVREHLGESKYVASRARKIMLSDNGRNEVKRWLMGSQSKHPNQTPPEEAPVSEAVMKAKVGQWRQERSKGKDAKVTQTKPSAKLIKKERT